MSKDKPEQNDIFTDGTHRIRVDDEVYDQSDRFYCYIFYGAGDKEEQYAENEILSLEKLQKYEYLGKAKHDIEDLFKTENE